MKIIFIFLLCVLCSFAQIQPTRISNRNIPYNYSNPSVVSLSGTQFAIFYGGPNNTLIIQEFPSNTTFVYQFQANSDFVEAILLQNGQVVTYFGYPDSTEIDGLILNSNLSIASIFNFSVSNSNFPGAQYYWGQHAIPTTQGFALASAVANGGPVVVQYIYFNGTLGNQVALPQGPALFATGVGFPNGSVLIIWDNTDGAWTLWYTLTDFKGNLLTPATQLNENVPNFNPEFAWLPNGELIMTWTTYADNIKFDIFESGSFTNLFTSPLKKVTDGEHAYEVLLPFKNGNMLVIWQGEPEDDINSPMIGLYGRIYNTSGPVSETFQVTGMKLTETPQPTNDWNAAILEDQTFVISWATPGENNMNLIYALRMNQQGQVVNFLPNNLNRYTVCDTVTFKCANTNFDLVYVGDNEIII